MMVCQYEDFTSLNTVREYEQSTNFQLVSLENIYFYEVHWSDHWKDLYDLTEYTSQRIACKSRKIMPASNGALRFSQT